VTRVIRPLLRLLVAAAIAAAGAACAARATPAAVSPRPFPMVSSPASLRPAPPARRSSLAASSTGILQTALGHRGVPYTYGGDSPATGFDCSGFIQYVLAKHEIMVPRTAAEQFQIGRRISARDVRAGDLVFFSTVAPGASHVGLAVSATEFVHAPATSGVVRVEQMQAAYWQARFVGARRLLSE
jgi:cell wall-associated NlpC family hydrolase